MVVRPLLAAFLAAFSQQLHSTARLPITIAFSPTIRHFHGHLHLCPAGRHSNNSSIRPLAASGKGFGEKPIKVTSKQPVTDPPSDTPTPPSPLLQQLRTRQAETRQRELQQMRQLLDSDSSPATLPERVAQRILARMFPLVGLPLLASVASLTGFWYVAREGEGQFVPAVVAAVSLGFLGMGLVGITYAVLSASWDEDREGSVMGWDEFQTNLRTIREGLVQSKENALLREKMARMSEEEIRKMREE